MLQLSYVLGFVLYWLAVPEAMFDAVLWLSTEFASGPLLLWCDTLELALCPSSSCADVSQDGPVFCVVAFDRSVQHLMIKLLGVLGVASVGVVLLVSGSLTDGIGEQSYVLPGCV